MFLRGNAIMGAVLYVCSYLFIYLNHLLTYLNSVDLKKNNITLTLSTTDCCPKAGVKKSIDPLSVCYCAGKEYEEHPST